MRINILLTAIIACCLGAFPTQTSAQTVVSCASQNNQRQYCPADTRGGVTLTRQTSQSPCVQNQTWGYDGRAIWVDGGCRADFQVGGNSVGVGPGGNIITCESPNNRRNYCRITDPRSNVELVQQLSQATCVRGQSWGNDGQGIWVDRGCRAQFRVNSDKGNGPGWWNSGPGHHAGNRPQVGACFFTAPNFGGDFFCLDRGSSQDYVPKQYNNKISSIQVYGTVTVTVYQDASFRGPNAFTRQSLSDLRTRAM